MHENIIEKQKEIITNMMNELMFEDMGAYYTDSRSLASMIYERIQNKNSDDMINDIVGKLNHTEILELITFKSSCC